jgi:ribosomal protein S27AE
MPELKRLFLMNMKQLLQWENLFSFGRNSQRVAVGRFCNNINTSNIKAHYANEDHCGPCGHTTVNKSNSMGRLTQSLPPHK